MTLQIRRRRRLVRSGRRVAIKMALRSADTCRMAARHARRYARGDWASWVMVSALDVTVLAVARGGGANFLVIVPILVVCSGIWLACAMTCGVSANDDGIACRSFGDTRIRRYPWSQIKRFDVRQTAGRVVIVAELESGRHVTMPGTMGWRFQQHEVSGICNGLNSELRAARH